MSQRKVLELKRYDPKPEIQRVLVLNTAHMSLKLTESVADGVPPAASSDDYGWWFWAGDPEWTQEEVHEHMAQEQFSPFPELVAAFRMALKLGCTHVRYDCDGPLFLGLADFTYDW